MTNLLTCLTLPRCCYIVYNSSELYSVLTLTSHHNLTFSKRLLFYIFPGCSEVFEEEEGFEGLLDRGQFVRTSSAGDFIVMQTGPS